MPAHLEEPPVAAFWEAGSLGVEVVSVARSRRQARIAMHAYFPGRLSRTTLDHRLAGALRRAGVNPPRTARLSPVPARDRVEQWQPDLATDARRPAHRGCLFPRSGS